MGKSHKEQLELQQQLEAANTLVEVGATYQHYKATHKLYTVVTLAFQEEDNELCVIYQSQYEERITFIRPLASWLQMVEWNSETVPRFTRA